MYTVITISTMVLGGWVLPSDETPTTPNAPAANTAPAPGATPVPQPPSSGPRRSSGPAPDARQAATAPSAPSAFITPLPSVPSAPSNAPAQLFVPLPPTDPVLGSPDSPWQAPTSASTTPVLGFGSAAAASGVTPYRLPASARSSQSGTNVRSPLTGSARPAARNFFPQSSTVSSSRVAGAKPFSGYRLPPALSPYINLTRINTSQDFDNYSLYVRPRLEQQAANQLFGVEIMGLHQNTRQQTQALRRIGQQIGAGAPQYFMNHGAFFPGLAR